MDGVTMDGSSTHAISDSDTAAKKVRFNGGSVAYTKRDHKSLIPSLFILCLNANTEDKRLLKRVCRNGFVETDTD